MHRKRKFAKIYETFADDIFRYLYVHVRERSTAEDLTAETFMRAWKASDRFDYKLPRPWLYKIARNVLTDHWRKQKPVLLEEGEEVVASDEMVEEKLDQQMTRERVQAAIARLPEQMRSVVTMRFVLGYSARKTAESLGVQENNVRIIQYRALKKMRGYLR